MYTLVATCGQVLTGVRAHVSVSETDPEGGSQILFTTAGWDLDDSAGHDPDDLVTFLTQVLAVLSSALAIPQDGVDTRS